MVLVFSSEFSRSGAAAALVNQVKMKNESKYFSLDEDRIFSDWLVVFIVQKKR